MSDSLQKYRDKRDFGLTPEPKGPAARRTGKRKAQALSFVIQKHAARNLHYDFRLELDGSLKSWAIPKGPSLDPAEKRMAVHVEDHPIEYGGFEGTIPAGQYGAGTVIVWDRGEWVPIGDPHEGYESGKLKFELRGEKLHGHWTLVRMRGRGERHEPWLLIKERDEQARPASEYAVVDELPDSVLGGTMGRTWDSARKAGDKIAAGSKKTAAGSKETTRAATATTAAATSTAAATARAGKRASKAASDAVARPAARKRSKGRNGTPRLPAGAVPAALPLTLAPQLATLADAVPESGDWLYEIKFDGYRLLARIDGEHVRLFTRNGNDWTSKMKSLAAAVQKLGLPSGWLDGEIVVNGPNRIPDFQALQNAFDSARTEDILYFVFDLPFYAGHDLRQVPLHQRRDLLRHIMANLPGEASPGRVQFSDDFPSTVSDLLKTACRMRFEGVIGKRRDAPYVSRRSPAWIKLKCTQRQEFVIGGYTEPKGSRTGLGALLLGIHDADGALRYAGNVGTGFDVATLGSLTAQLKTLSTGQPAFADKPRDVKGNWVRPKLVAEISFAEWTHEGRIRHAVFHGLRDDKSAAAISREKVMPVEQAEKDAEAEVVSETKKARGKASAVAAKKGTKAKASVVKKSGDDMVGGIRISHPERVIDGQSGVTKLDLARYYERAAKVMLPHLIKRPVSLVRGPDGVGGELFFQKHADPRGMPHIKQLDPSFDTDHEPLLEVDSPLALLGAVQMNTIEFHTWNAITKAIEKPDRMTFDLDPGEGVGWKQIQEAAQLTHALLDELGLQSFLKTSGGKGLHVVVPFAPKLGWDDVKSLSQTVVQHLAKTLPDRFVSKSGPRNRIGRIFVDYLRNGRGATTASAFSARARPGMGVSVPVGWDELAMLTGGAHWTVVGVDERLEMGNEPWGGYAGASRQTLSSAMKLLGYQLGGG